MTPPFSSSPQTRAWARVVCTAVLVAACADSPFERVNAFDPSFRTTAKVIGLPDTFTSIGDTAQLRLEADDRFRDIPRRWSVRRLGVDTVLCNCEGVTVDSVSGRVVAVPSSFPFLWEIGVRIGAQRFYDTVVTRQIPVTFQSRCPQEDCFVYAYNAPADFSETSAVLFDARGVRLTVQRDTALLAGTRLTIRDTTILHFVDGAIYSRFKDGTTWIVRSQYNHVDSSLFTVRQFLRVAQPQCPLFASIGDTVRIRMKLTDGAGTPIAGPVTLTWGISFGTWTSDRSEGDRERAFIPQLPITYRVGTRGTHATGSVDAGCEVIAR